ncbi:hypothetical protein EJ110_NYTH55402 [Nymphaea thermarum]|nr:hypothetical protein EJ110_NYTH55402 [Nymphaea thermarum]
MVKNRPVESKIAHFIGGLNEDIQIEMLRDPPTELRKCFALAKVIEEQFRCRDAQKKIHKPGFVSKPNANTTEVQEEICNEVCKGVSLEMQKTPFTIDLYLLPIGGVDLVLGIQWMKPLKRTLLDWENMTLTFPKEGGGEITLEAINPKVDPKPALRALIANQPAFLLVSMVKDVHRYALRDGRQRHEVLIEWEGPDGGTSWEELDQIRLCWSACGSLQNPREANFLSLPTASTTRSGIIRCEAKSSTLTTEDCKAPSRAGEEISREVKAPLCIEDLGRLDLGDLDPPGLGEEDPNLPCLEEDGLGALSLGVEDPVYTGPVEDGLVTHDSGSGGLGLEERADGPSLDQG